MSEERKYARNDVIGATIDEDLILFDATAGKYFATGAVGADIWAHLSSPLSLDELCTRLALDYDVDREACRRDVVEFIERLLAAGLITVANADEQQSEA